MLNYAKENPGKVRYSTVFGSTTEYVGTMLERQAGVEFDNINVGTSGGERMAAMLGGHATELGYDKVVTAKKYEVKFPKGTDKAIVEKLSGICKEIVLNDKSYADVSESLFCTASLPGCRADEQRRP